MVIARVNIAPAGGVLEGSSGCLSLFLRGCMCCGPSTEPPRRGGFDEQPVRVFLWGLTGVIPQLSSGTPLIWSSVKNNINENFDFFATNMKVNVVFVTSLGHTCFQLF